jgi:hypothetical protein
MHPFPRFREKVYGNKTENILELGMVNAPIEEVIRP